MKFGYFCNTTNWTHKPYHQLLDETKEITEYCDQNKWNSIWFTEHHFNHEGMESCTNPLMMGADAAARTKNIRIGQAANVITFHNRCCRVGRRTGGCWPRKPTSYPVV